MSLLEVDFDDAFERVNITDPRTFFCAATIMVLFGLMVGLGYYMIFTQFPDLKPDQRIAVVILSIMPGVIAGSAPYIYQKWKDEGEIVF